MFAILPLLFNKPWGKVTWIGLGAALFAMATYDSTLGAFMEYAQSLGALVDESELFDGYKINFLRVAVYWVPSILALVFRKRELFKTRKPFLQYGDCQFHYSNDWLSARCESVCQDGGLL